MYAFVCPCKWLHVLVCVLLVCVCTTKEVKDITKLLFFMQTSSRHFPSSAKAISRHRTDIFVRQTLLRLNIDIWVNFEPAVATQSHFRTQNCWTLESSQGMFLQVYSTLENVLQVHHTLERATTGPSGNPQWGPSRGLKPLQRGKEEKREWLGGGASFELVRAVSTGL